LQKAALARGKRAQNDLDSLEKKLVREAKRSQADLMNRLDAIHELALPGGKLQERTENFASLFVAYGEEWSSLLLEALDPFAQEFTVIS